ATFGFHPFQFSYQERRLTMEEMLNKFIKEGKREHEEMETFIIEFRTTNELLLKERNNLLSELGIEVHRTTTRIAYNNEINNINKKPSELPHDKLEEPRDTILQNDPHKTKEIISQPTVEVQVLPVPFPHRLRKEKEEAQQQKFLENSKQLHVNLPFIKAIVQMPKYAKFLKSLLTNKSRLEEACTVTMNKRCSAVLLNKLPSKEKDPGSFTIPCHIGNLNINNALADLGASIRLMAYTMYGKLGLGEPKPTRMSLELADRSIQYPR
ncbi:retrovirus-related pol polyprotein from transposon TNT 1-94, partial [Tanacetum coccineum]